MKLVFRMSLIPALAGLAFVAILVGGFVAGKRNDQQLARIEPVLSSGDGQNPRRGSRELVAVRTSHLPKSAAIWRLVEAEHFFDAAVAVRAHDQHWAGQVADILCAQNHVVMKLALRPVIKQLVRSAASLQCLKQLA